ncbi:MAG: DUF1254 domain-containing protein [Bacteroidota bacterium]|nr:DUF1254 domain-containing protein [Bacteroidota bacterium]
MEYQHLIIFGSVIVAAWFLFIYLWPLMLLYIYKRSVLAKGGGDGPVPLNTLYTVPQTIFANPFHAPAGASKFMTTGVNHDTLLTAGWLDLRKGPQILHVPDMAGRYYSVQFTDTSKNINFAYVGKRATGTKAGNYIITGPGWKGQVPSGMKRISSPNNSPAIFGRTLVESESDLPTAYGLAKQIQITPLRD